MKIAVLGTGMVGRALAGRLADLDHSVVIGTRDPAATMARTEPDAAGAPPYSTWQREHPEVSLVPLAQAGADAEVLINATAGTASLSALADADIGNRSGLVIIDVANALQFTGSMPILAVANTDSLGEQIQRAYPGAHVVKTLNTVNCHVMVDPARVPGEHTVFVAGDDAAAKQTTCSLLQEMGWPTANILDLGGIAAARGTEMFLPLWLHLMQTLGTGDFNIAVVA